jgi:uncharacterized protein with HEPN domain
MLTNDVIRLQHMLDAAHEAIQFASGHSRADLNRDRMLVLALVKAIEIIGEAAYRISPTTRAQLQDIPWDDIVAMRHRLVHAYFDINLDILWRTVTDDIPSLIALLQPHLAEGES